MLVSDSILDCQSAGQGDERALPPVAATLAGDIQRFHLLRQFAQRLQQRVDFPAPGLPPIRMALPGTTRRLIRGRTL